MWSLQTQRPMPINPSLHQQNLSQLPSRQQPYPPLLRNPLRPRSLPQRRLILAAPPVHRGSSPHAGRLSQRGPSPELSVVSRSIPGQFLGRCPCKRDQRTPTKRFHTFVVGSSSTAAGCWPLDTACEPHDVITTCLREKAVMRQLLRVWLLFFNREQNKDMQVVMGGLTLSSEEPTEQTLRVEEAIRHEGYRETSKAVYNDIGDPLLENAPPKHHSKTFNLKCLYNFCPNCSQACWGSVVAMECVLMRPSLWRRPVSLMPSCQTGRNVLFLDGVPQSTVRPLLALTLKSDIFVFTSRESSKIRDVFCL